MRIFIALTAATLIASPALAQDQDYRASTYQPGDCTDQQTGGINKVIATDSGYGVQWVCPNTSKWIGAPVNPTDDPVFRSEGG